MKPEEKRDFERRLTKESKEFDREYAASERLRAKLIKRVNLIHQMNENKPLDNPPNT